MKKQIKNLAAILLVGSLIITSCKKEETIAPITPQNNNGGGTTEDERDAFVGSYIMVDSVFYEGTLGDTVLASVDNYIFNIVKHTTDNSKVWLLNYANKPDSVIGTISGNYLSIPQQTYGSYQNPITIETDGLSELANNKISLNTIVGVDWRKGKGTKQ